MIKKILSLFKTKPLKLESKQEIKLTRPLIGRVQLKNYNINLNIQLGNGVNLVVNELFTDSILESNGRQFVKRYEPNPMDVISKLNSTGYIVDPKTKRYFILKENPIVSFDLIDIETTNSKTVELYDKGEI